MHQKWTGVVQGTNRGFVILDAAVVGDDLNGHITLFDVDGENVRARVKGKVKGQSVVAKLDSFQPTGNGNPTEGTIEATLSQDGREMNGTWKTNAETSGNLLLYQITSQAVEQGVIDPKLTLETRELPVRFCTFDSQRIKEIFGLIHNVCKERRQGYESQINPPIYSITYDGEESIRTYVLEDFLSKLEGAKQISHVGVEFQVSYNQRVEKVNLSFSYQPNLTYPAMNHISVASTEKNMAIMVSEMLRGAISKAKNYNWWCHRRYCEAVVQLIAVISIISFSYMVKKKLSAFLGNEEVSSYGFIAALIILSNLWTYLSSMLFAALYKYNPVVEIINRPKNKLLPRIFFAVAASSITGIIYYFVQLLWKFFAVS